MVFDVVVVGAGPAGSTAARICAKAGLRVGLFEEHDRIGLPLACGEGMSIDKIKELKIPFSEPRSKFKRENRIKTDLADFIDRKLSAQRFMFSDQGTAVSQLDVVTINRPKFDNLLAAAAEKEGTEIFTGERVENVEIQQDKVIFDTYNEDKLIQSNIEANMLLACDGPAARIPKSIGLSPPASYVQGIEVKVKGVYTDALDFYFDHDLFPMGYGWVFPKVRETNIGLVVELGKNPRERLDEFLERLKKEFAIKSFEIEKEIAGIIPASGPIEKTYTNRALVVGDSGGFTNAVFYGGIAIAIHTAQLAAFTAIEAKNNNDYSEAFLKQYENKWKQMPYASPKIQQAHKKLYHEITNEELKSIGKLIDGLDITTLGTYNKIKLFIQVLTNAKLRSHLKDLLTIVDGFRTSRDWGF